MRQHHIKLTPNQLSKLNDMFCEMQPLGAIMAQIFVDGMHVKLLSPEEARSVQQSMVNFGISGGSVSNSAIESYERGIQRDKEQRNER